MADVYCPEPYIKPDQRSRRYQSPLVVFRTIVKPTAGFDGDVPLVIPIPARQIIVVSTRNANLSDSLFMSFRPLNLAFAGLAITPFGNEEWLPLCNFAATPKSKIGQGWVFDHPLPQGGTVYLQIGQENGGAANLPITFAFSESIINWHLGNQS